MGLKNRNLKGLARTSGCDKKGLGSFLKSDSAKGELIFKKALIRNFFILWLWPGICFFISLSLYPGKISTLSSIFFNVSLFWLISFFEKGGFWTIFFWGTMLDIYKSNCFGVYLSGILCLYIIVQSVSSKLIWQNYLNQILYILFAFLFLCFWRYVLSVVFDLQEDLCQFNQCLLMAFVGGIFSPIIYKFYCFFQRKDAS